MTNATSISGVKRWSVSVVAAVCAVTGMAGLEPLSPADKAVVKLVPDMQRQVMELSTLEKRLAFFDADRKNDKKAAKDENWRRSVPFAVSFRPTAGEIGPWTVRIGKKPDLSDARAWHRATARAKRIKGSDRRQYPTSDGKPVVLALPDANLEIGTRYYWQVSAHGNCKRCSPTHSCSERKTTVESPILSFVTDGFAPRWITVEGRVANIRDLGGRTGLNGRRVRQGLVFRGQGLNDNSVDGEHCGANRLTVEDVKYLTEVLGLKTDLDLRTDFETADLKYSPLGVGIAFVRHSSKAYLGVASDEGKKAMADNFRLFLDRANYPIYFHCIGGADRTGTLAYVLNGVLGVSQHELETDWESTFYPRIPDENPDPDYWCRESHFNTLFGTYGAAGDSLCRRLELYLNDCGITDAEIAKFRGIMLEE